MSIVEEDIVDAVVDCCDDNVLLTEAQGNRTYELNMYQTMQHTEHNYIHIYHRYMYT